MENLDLMIEDVIADVNNSDQKAYYKIRKTYCDDILITYSNTFDVSTLNTNQTDYDIRCYVLKDNEYVEFFYYNCTTQYQWSLKQLVAK